MLVRTGGRLATSRMHVATPSPCSLHCASRSSPHSERTASSWYSCTSPAAASFWTSNGMEYPRYAAGLACDWRWLQTNTHCQCSKQTMAANKQRQGNCGHPGWAGMATSGGSRWVVGWGGGAKSCLRALTTTWALQRKTAGLNAKSVSAEKTSTMSCAVSLAMLRKAAMPWSACIHAPSFAALLVTLFAM